MVFNTLFINLVFVLHQIMALEEMKKNVEKLDELDDSLRKAVDELAVSP